MLDKKRILLFSIESINNAGDEILRVTTEHILRQIDDCLNIKRAQLRPSWYEVKRLNKVTWIIGTVMRKVSRYVPHKALSYKMLDASYSMAFRQYYQSNIRRADKVIVTLGGLKYSTQDFSFLIHLITTLCSKSEVPVLLSAMSPELGNKEDWRYWQLVEAVNRSSVKMVTTRDGQDGVDVIVSDYIKRDISCDFVGDPALWIPDVYGIKKNNCKTSAPYIGINVIRKGIFKDYNKSLSDTEMFHIYEGLVKAVQDRGWDYALFCNGMKQDWQVLMELKQSLHLKNDKIIPVPGNGKEYVQIVSKFDAVFGSRLHCCITSVALGIPVVCFVWDNKLKYFGKTMKLERFFFHPSEMTVDSVLVALEEAMKNEVNIVNRDFYKQKTLSAFKEFIMN